MVVRPRALVWFELFDCTVDLLVSNILECCTRIGVFEVWVDFVMFWRREEKGIVQGLCFILVFSDFFNGTIGLFYLEYWYLGFCTISG